MRGLSLDAVGVVTYRDDLADPVLEDERDAIVKVTAAGLCGSDLHPYSGREATRFGIVPGHEIVGTVIETGAGVTAFAPGAHVLAAFTTSCGSCEFCLGGLSARCVSGQLFGYGDPAGTVPPLHGGQAEFVRVPLADSTLVAVPDGLSASAAILLTDNLPTGWHAARRAEVTPGAAVAVVGLGSVGLCAVVAALAQGAGSVLAIDPVSDRRDRARSLGATVASPDDVPGERFPAVIEAAGTAAAQRTAFKLLRPGGTLSIIAVQTSDTFAFTPVEAYDANVTVRAGRAPVRSILDELLAEVAGARLAVPGEAVVTHPNVALEDGPATYRAFAARESGMIKAIFIP